MAVGGESPGKGGTRRAHPEGAFEFKVDITLSIRSG